MSDLVDRVCISGEGYWFLSVTVRKITVAAFVKGHRCLAVGAFLQPADIKCFTLN